MNSTHALVTGAAGFIGSHLTERLLREGARVTGVDCLTDYYDPSLKRRNLSAAQTHPGFTLLELDLVTGRRHQIRAHLYSIGHPVCGDMLYGQERPVAGAPRLMLHSLEAAFDDLKVRVEPPPDFLEGLARFLPA